MKKSSIITIILLSIFCSGCKKYCPAFPADLNYFPYIIGQEVRFTNQQQDMQIYTIAKKFDSKAESFGINCLCSCEISSSFSTNTNDDFFAHFYLAGDEIISSAEIYFRNWGLAKTIFKDQKIPIDEVSKYIGDTITIENENNQIVTKVIVANNKGIVSYTTADGEEWKLVE